MNLHVHIFAGFVLSCFVQPGIAQQNDVTIKVEYKGKSYYGRPLAWDRKDLVLLRTDGRISVLPAKRSEEFDRVADSFQPISKQKIRTRLQREFGAKYQVSAMKHFVVVHPPGAPSKWAAPFEKLYHRFENYFEKRHFDLKDPEFPMVAVVLKSRGEFDRFLKSYHSVNDQVIGYYNPRSNRIITYDQTEGKLGGQDWFFNASTIIHEATHQTAYNTGIHSRYSSVPRWMSEGLALMFEAPGVNNSKYNPKQVDRINRERLIELKRYYQQNRAQGKLRSLITEDRLFREDQSLAYALSWGLTFYLAENRSGKYFEFLKHDASRDAFTAYSGSDRGKSFSRFFGSNMRDLEARVERFIDKLPVPSHRK